MNYEGASIDIDEGFPLPDTENVRFCGSVRNTGGELELTGVVSGVFVIPCARCLKETKQEFSSDVYEKISNGGFFEDEFGDDRILISGGTIDISETVRESALIEFPIRTLCKDGCMGLCPVCGSDRNISDCGCVTGES